MLRKDDIEFDDSWGEPYRRFTRVGSAGSGTKAKPFSDSGGKELSKNYKCYDSVVRVSTDDNGSLGGEKKGKKRNLF